MERLVEKTGQGIAVLWHPAFVFFDARRRKSTALSILAIVSLDGMWIRASLESGARSSAEPVSGRSRFSD
jgi:hypothetical protein